MRVVYCIHSLHKSGGTERVITTKMNYLADNTDNDIYVVLKKEEGTPFFTLSNRVKKINLSANSKKEYKKLLKNFLFNIRPDITISVGGEEVSFINDFKDGSKKVLEFHFTKNFLVNFVKGLKKIRFRTLHLLKVWLIQTKLRYDATKFDKVVGLTQRDVELWGKPKNMTYIYNPLSFKSSKKSTLKNKAIIAVGSFTPAKGMDLLVEAFGQIAHKYPDWRMSIYGSGQDEQLLHALIRQYGIEEQVYIKAPVLNIQDKMLESSIYAFPSRSDGFGLVITEAMECGLPCVAFDCECGPREILSDSTGILVPSRDICGFAAGLEKLITDEELRCSMGKQSIIEVQRFYLENIMPKWIGLFNQLLIN